jgi:hypothetical protein
MAKQGGEAKLLDRCAEGMLFGALPACPSCDEGQLVCVRGVEYKCTGYASGKRDFAPLLVHSAPPAVVVVKGRC